MFFFVAYSDRAGRFARTVAFRFEFVKKESLFAFVIVFENEYIYVKQFKSTHYK